MFCPNCGKNVDQKLKFCNSCGERLARHAEDKDSIPGKMLDDILETLFWFGILGLGILVGLVAILLGNNVEPKFVVFISIAYLAAIVLVCYTLSSQVPKLIDARLKAAQAADEIPQVAQLSSPTTAQLIEYREPAMSVTDHTTRTLDEVPLKSKG